MPARRHYSLNGAVDAQIADRASLGDSSKSRITAPGIDGFSSRCADAREIDRQKGACGHSTDRKSAGRKASGEPRAENGWSGCWLVLARLVETN